MFHLCALEAGWDLLAAVVQEQAKWDRNIKVDAQNIGLDGGAEAHGRLEIDQTGDERAARGFWRGSDDEVHQVIEQIGAHTQF